jgi:hypothetical protein
MVIRKKRERSRSDTDGRTRRDAIAAGCKKTFDVPALGRMWGGARRQRRGRWLATKIQARGAWSSLSSLKQQPAYLIFLLQLTALRQRFVAAADAEMAQSNVDEDLSTTV